MLEFARDNLPLKPDDEPEPELRWRRAARAHGGWEHQLRQRDARARERDQRDDDQDVHPGQPRDAPRQAYQLQPLLLPLRRLGLDAGPDRQQRERHRHLRLRPLWQSDFDHGQRYYDPSMGRWS